MKKLVFVYNGDSGLINGVMHYLHKRISPDTYPCELCGMVYDGTALNKDWLAFVKSMGMPTEFLHRDEYRKQYGKSALDWPAVLQALRALPPGTLVANQNYCQLYLSGKKGQRKLTIRCLNRKGEVLWEKELMATIC